MSRRAVTIPRDAMSVVYIPRAMGVSHLYEAAWRPVALGLLSCVWVVGEAILKASVPELVNRSHGAQDLAFAGVLKELEEAHSAGSRRCPRIRTQRLGVRRLDLVGRQRS
jgi:hypothetical protein